MANAAAQQQSESKITQPTENGEDWIIFTRLPPEKTEGVIAIDQNFRKLTSDSDWRLFRLEYRFSSDEQTETEMPNDSATTQYFQVEDEIDDKFGKRAVAASRVSPGRREAFVFAKGATALEQIEMICAKVSLQTTATATTLDEIERLLPDRTEYMMAMNYKIAQGLQKAGDNGLAQRKIEHLILLHNVNDPAGVERELRKRRYAIDEISAERIEFHRNGAIDLSELDGEVRWLNDLCRRYGALYDGWGAEVVRD